MTRSELFDLMCSTKEAALRAYELPKSDLEKRYAPGKWTVREVLHHLADAEFVYLWRYLRGVAEPGAGVYGFDQDAWCRNLAYPQRHVLLSRELFHSARNMALYYLETLPETVFAHTIHHSEAGELPLSKVLDYWSTHTQHHLGQIHAACEGRVWTPPGG